MAEKNLIKIYVNASSAKRVDIIIKHYTDFMGIVEGYTEGLRYMIECEKDSNSRSDIGELGVRVQTGGSTSDPTAKHAIRNVMTREALINCDFSGDVMEGVDRAEEFMREAYLLRDMRKDYELFNRPPFSFWPQSLPASASFPISWLFASGRQSIGASALASILPMNFRIDFL